MSFGARCEEALPDTALRGMGYVHSYLLITAITERSSRKDPAHTRNSKQPLRKYAWCYTARDSALRRPEAEASGPVSGYFKKRFMPARSMIP